MNVEKYSNKIKSSYQVDVFFSTELDSISCRDCYNKIYAFPFITEGEFISSNQALSIFSNHFKQDIQMLLGVNPLPCSGKFTLVKSFQNLEAMEKIKKQLLVIEGVDDIHFEDSLIGNLDKLSDNIVIVFITLGIILFCITLFILVNTMKLVLFYDKQIMSTLELLGASSIFIWTPIVFQSILQGLIGGIVASSASILFISLIYYLFNPIIVIPSAISPLIIFLNILLGIILGIVGMMFCIPNFGLDEK